MHARPYVRAAVRAGAAAAAIMAVTASAPATAVPAREEARPRPAARARALLEAHGLELTPEPLRPAPATREAPPARPAKKPARPPAEIAIAAAKAQIGKPYVWGGTGPHGFDCSGLSSYAWAKAGISLPRTSRAQYAALPKVPLDAMRPGDLVFSGWNGRISHLGIYLGNGQMVHAPRTGKRIEISPLHKNLIGAARPGG